MEQQSIKTDRLILRRWRPNDSASFYQLNSDPAVVEFLLKPLALRESDEMIERIEKHFSQHGFGLWAIEIQESGELAGFTGIHYPSFEAHFTPCVEIGWRLANAFWGRGFATEAARAALAYGFLQANLLEIVSFTVPANTRSISVMEKIGMTRSLQDDFDHPRVPEGSKLRHHLLYRISRGEFMSKQELE